MPGVQSDGTFMSIFGPLVMTEPCFSHMVGAMVLSPDPVLTLSQGRLLEYSACGLDHNQRTHKTIGKSIH